MKNLIYTLALVGVGLLNACVPRAVTVNGPNGCYMVAFEGRNDGQLACPRRNYTSFEVGFCSNGSCKNLEGRVISNHAQEAFKEICQDDAISDYPVCNQP